MSRKKEENNVLVVIDMQGDFIDGSLGTKEAKAIVKNVCKEIKKKEYSSVVFTRDTHGKDYLESLEGKNLPIEHCIKDTSGWGIHNDILIAALNRNGNKINIIDKHKFGCYSKFAKDITDFVCEFDFHGKPLNEIDSITICGLCTDVCVISNALILKAAFPNVPMYYKKDCCAGTTPEMHEAACKVMESCQIYKK